VIPHAVFYERRDKYCALCLYWKGVCLKGHTLQSAQGCPLQKFPPLHGADYAPDRAVPDAKAQPDPRLADCCTGSTGMPAMAWPQVIQHFAASMAQWVASGLKLADSDRHGQRYGVCKACPRFRGFYCEICKCLAYAKTKLASESCPDNPPRWL